ncbi:MAG: hypothetical protein ACPGVY_15040, partial [Mycobacterium sp.]
MIEATVNLGDAGAGSVTVSGKPGGVLHGAHGPLRVSVGEIKGGHWRLVIKNSGDVALNKGRTPGGGEPVGVSTVNMAAPEGWVMPIHTPATKGWPWGEQARRIDRPSAVEHSMIPGSDVRFFLNGGAKIWFDFTAPGVEAYPAPTEMPERCRSWMGRGEAWAEIGVENPYRWAALKPFLDRWRDRGATLDTTYHYGMLPWGASGPGNHYDQLAAMITAYFEAPDPEYWDFICAHARHRLTKELIASNPGDPFHMRFHYEKTDGPGRQYGSGNMAVPVYSHEWNAGLLMWRDITGDPSASFLLKGHGSALVAQ